MSWQSFDVGDGNDIWYTIRPDSRSAPSQWGTALLYNAVYHWLGLSLDSANAVSHWLDANLESALYYCILDGRPVHKHSLRITYQKEMDIAWHNEAGWRINASRNRVIIGSDNGLSPFRHQAIIWIYRCSGTYADVLDHHWGIVTQFEPSQR